MAWRHGGELPDGGPLARQITPLLTVPHARKGHFPENSGHRRKNFPFFSVFGAFFGLHFSANRLKSSPSHSSDGHTFTPETP